MTSPPNATERNQHTLKLNSAQGGAGEVLSEVAGWAGASWCSLAVDGGASSLFSGIAAVAPACALAGVFAKASAQASSGPAMRGITGFVWFDDSKDAPGGPVPPSNPKKTLRLRKSEPRNRGKDPFIRSLTPPWPVQHGGGSQSLEGAAIVGYARQSPGSLRQQQCSLALQCPQRPQFIPAPANSSPSKSENLHLSRSAAN
jgi:hypothetical protein